MRTASLYSVIAVSRDLLVNACAPLFMCSIESFLDWFGHPANNATASVHPTTVAVLIMVPSGANRKTNAPASQAGAPCSLLADALVDHEIGLQAPGSGQSPDPMRAENAKLQVRIRDLEPGAWSPEPDRAKRESQPPVGWKV